MTTPQTLNPYPYVVNNPLKYVDPLGLRPAYGVNSWEMPEKDPIAIVTDKAIEANTDNDTDWSECPQGTGKTDIGNVKGNTIPVVAATATVPLTAPSIGELVKKNPGVTMGLGITTIIVVSQEVSDNINSYIADKIKNVFFADDDDVPTIDYPGNDPTVSPGEDYEWRGKGEPTDGEGSYYNPNTGESLHPDLKHPEPIGPHWDYNYRGSGTDGWRVYPDGSIQLK